MLKLTDVAVAYGSFTAIKHVNIEVAQGEIVVLLGANGAGKSTTFRSISGISKLSRGEIHFQGIPIGGGRLIGMCGRGLSSVPKGVNCSLR